MSALLELRGLTLELATDRGPVPVVEDLDLRVAPGETLALVGESGSGKTLTGLAVLGLLPAGVRVARGEIRYRGRDLVPLAEFERRALRGAELAMSFQEPASALNPVLRVGEQVAEVLRHRAGLKRASAWQRAVALLGEVGLEDAAARARRFPHELSGGQRQRVMLAIALALGPSLLIADEPTSALDAPVQAEILALLAALRTRREMAMLLVTHDLGVVRELASRVAVLYAGKLVEEGPTAALFERPQHPYTLGLLRSRARPHARGARFAAVPGQVPAPGAWPSGCRFHPRCALADERCRSEDPRLPAADEPLAPRAACHHAGEGGAP